MSKPNVLVVDDERFFISLLEEILNVNYNVIFANSGTEALGKIHEQRIDLVLLDIVMPGIDGYEVCQKIKSAENSRKIPVIFLTVKNKMDDELKGFSLGAVDYITKPISPPIVLARVATHIALAQANEKLRLHTIELEQLVAQRTVELTREITEKQKVYEKLHYLAHYDQLTQLPNRNLFNERLSYTYKLAKRKNTSFSLLLIDLDRFKHVNDSLGHHIGDLLLKQVGLRLSDCLRGVDTVARLGGDEFTVTLTEIEKKEDAAVVAKKIITELSRPFEIDGQPIHIGSSIGITNFPDDGEELNTMLKNADMAMYEAKSKGKNAYFFFSPDMTAHANHRMEIEKDLHHALLNNELYLNYQTITDLQSNKIFGVEALLRWSHPKYGQVPPDKTISIAEESDLILKLGEWILATACKQLSLWQDKGFSDLHMAINMSPRQFDEKSDSVTIIKNLIQQYQLDHHSLQLEITENMMLRDSSVLMKTLYDLKELGVFLSIDDFGTGYSSLSYLRRFPVDILKIDKSFIRDIHLDPGNDTLVKAIIAMGQSLNLKIVAEGIETQQQLSFLQDQGCHYAQGNFFSKPSSVNKIEMMLEEQRRI